MEHLNEQLPITITQSKSRARDINDRGGNAISLEGYSLSDITQTLFSIDKKDLKIVIVDKYKAFDSTEVKRALNNFNLEFKEVDVLNNISVSVNDRLLRYSAGNNQTHAMQLFMNLSMGVGEKPIR